MSRLLFRLACPLFSISYFHTPYYYNLASQTLDENHLNPSILFYSIFDFPWLCNALTWLGTLTFCPNAPPLSKSPPDQHPILTVLRHPASRVTVRS
ncbi:hypothetical protein ACN42_g4863 [Penicillium freii]|uniref:Uncharacterized protein n=1 Tax=Penicillium freii TaxID=48697 RepID=A0A101MKG4_PENFR|nr:hypothetical protein ACN42_g4863 [Penicillium freii]